MKAMENTFCFTEKAARRWFMALLILSVTLLSVSYTAAVTIPFTDDVENASSTDWVADSPWGRVTTQYQSSTTSWTDSPSAFYSNSADTALTLATTIDLTTATNPVLSFWHKQQLEQGYDNVHAQYSEDGGVTWNTLMTFTGTQETWLRRQVALPTKSIKIRFHLATDSSVQMDGFYVDDIVIGEKPAAVTLSAPSGATSSSLTLSWGQSGIGNFQAYKLFRSLTGEFTYQDRILVAELTNSAMDSAPTSFTDTGLAQKTTYYYALYVLNTLGLASDINVVSATTLAGLSYPFQDNMEAGGGNWIAGGNWTLVTPTRTHSGNKVFTDSPSANYSNSSESSLTLAGNISITDKTQLVFWHRLYILAGDTAYVEVSTDSGSTWTTLTSYTEATIGDWTRVQINLGTYSSTPVTLRFRLSTDTTSVADGWYIDDVTLSNKPTEVALATPTPLTGTDAGKMSLSWTANTDTSFLAYEIHRATLAGVTLSSQLVATITAQGTTTFTDVGLDPNKVYYYKVFVINGFYAYSDGSNEASQKPVGYFSDNAESGVGTFVADSPWARTTESAHSGTYSWTDSPGTTYANNISKSLKFPVSLSGAIMPYLGFWHSYAFEANSDYGFVEISTDNGTNWTKLFFVTGSSAEWRYETIDLTVYAGLNILLRFRLVSDNNGTVSDGWHIDDVTVSESTVVVSYPFVDNMDTEATTRANWTSSSWDLKADSHSSPFSWTDSPAGNYAASMSSSFVLAGAIDLTTAVHPQLTFWHKYDFIRDTSYYYEYDYGLIYVSDYYGQTGTWIQVASFSGSQASWKQEQIDLSAYTGLSKVRVKFVVYDSTRYAYNDTRQSGGWYIDDVEISNAPVDVVLSTPTGVTMHGATLTWTANADPDFQQYEIYRATSSSVSRSSTLVATITAQGTTTYTNTPYYLLRPEKFYYRIYVKDTTGQYSPGSNVVSADYTVPTVGFPSYPFADGAESGASSWQFGGLWSITSAQNHTSGGANSFTDSPDTNYPDNANYSMDTIVNLSGTNSPVLTFWHKYIFEDGVDYGYVEVSTNQGSSWTALLTVTGQNAVWNQERINLTAYVGNAALWLRFRLYSNASSNYDGWYVDDISIAESTVANAFPLNDDMESGVGKWFYDSPWELTTANAHSGTTSWADSPGSSYAKSANFSLRTVVNLSNTTMPVLSFWHQYSFEANHDYGFVELSNDNGATWTKVYFVTGQAAEWRQVFIDLANYAGDILYIRFRVTDDGNGTMADGWYLDDIAVSEATGTIVYPFLDNMDTEATTRANWISSSWDLKTDFHSSPLSWTDSPLGNYGANVRPSLVLASVIDLTNAVKPQLTFWHKYDFVRNTSYYYEYDYGKVYASDYYGQSGTWREVGSFNGSQSTWKQVQIDLSAYAGLSKVRVKFVVEDNIRYAYNDTSQADGWYIDDVEISDAPTDVTLSQPTDVTMHGATLNWTMNTESDFNRYEIYRSTSSSVGLSSTLIATITDPTVTTYTDTPYMTLRPGTFSYRVYAIDNTDIYSLGSNVVTANYTVPLVSFPFSEDAEGGGADWQMGYTWGITDSQAYTGVYSMTDSPNGNYPDSADYSLDTTVDLSGANTPVLIFWHSYVFEPARDFGYVQVSTNQGTSWTTLLTVTGQSTAWKQQRINLHPYAGNANLWLRFRIVSNSSINYDGWYLDDISIAEGLVVNSYPFSDQVESGIEGWFYDSPWGRTNSYAYSGTWSWTDSPGSTYVDNVDTSLVTSVNLVGATMPMLTFWQQYSLETNHDYAFVEASIDKGATWTKLYFTTGSAASWVKEKIDLTAYAGREIALRFRVTSDGNGVVSDGWYVDDITIEETPYGSLNTVPYPFSDNMDDPAAFDSYWISSSWERVVNGRSLPNSWHDSPQGNYYPGMTKSSLVLAGIINLTDTVSPQLSFWHKHSLYREDSGSNVCYWECDYGRVYVSSYYGQPGTWTNVGSFKGSQSTWKYERIDLSAYKGVEAVRVMFVLEDYVQYYYGNNRLSDGWWIDDIRIGETAVITQENSRLVRPNTTVNYAHTIINYSTVSDTFNLAAVSNHGWAVTLYKDTDGDGVLDSDETTVVTSTGSLAAGASYFIIAKMVVPWTGAGTTDTTTITATSTNDPSVLGAVTDTTTVDYVYGVTLSPDTSGRGIPGATASIPHTITNTGNADDYFWLTVASTQALSVRLYRDANGNGIVDSGERTPISFIGPVTTGEQFNLIAEIDIPASALQGDTMGATITAASYYSSLAFDITTDVITVSELTSFDIGLLKLTMLVGEEQDFLILAYADTNLVTFYGVMDWEVRGGIGAIDDFGVFTATSTGLGAVVLRDLSGVMPTISQMVDVLGPAGGVTQNETGTLLNSDGTPPPDDSVQFQAYITSSPSEVLSQEAPGSGYGGGQWQVNVGNFPTPWQSGDMLHIDFVNLDNGQVGSIEYALANQGQSNGVFLSPVSYSLETTPKTDVNSLVLFLDIGVTDAEGLVSAIPNATEIAYWDAESQAYVAHTRGLSLFNFPVVPGHPYFVTVTANTVWTPSGSVPSTSFNLIITGSTDVNMIGVALHMSRIKNAEELCIVIPGCAEVAYWDTPSQAYVAHTLGVPLFNFDVRVGLPVFVTVTEESLWP